MNPKPGVSEESHNHLVEVAYIGTGFMRVRRHVFEQLIDKLGDELWFTTDDGKNEKQHDFWRMGVYKYKDGTRRWLSEDWYFCQMCADIGIKIWADLNILLGHSGHAVYPLETQLPYLFPQKEISAELRKGEAVGAGAADSPPTAPALTAQYASIVREEAHV